MRSSALRLFLMLAFAMGQASALELGERLQLHGFASQNVLQTSANRYFGDSEDISTAFSEIGLNLSYRLDARMLLAAQVLSRRAGDMYDGEPTLDYGLLDLRLVSSASRIAGVRLGRIKNPLGLYNETRDVPFTRPGIFLPLVYFDNIRNQFLSSDGMAAYVTHQGASGRADLTLGLGRPLLDTNVEWIWFNNDYDAMLVPDGLAWFLSLWYSTPDERLRLGLSSVGSDMNFKPEMGSGLPSGSIGFIYTLASLQYNARDWSLSAEYARVPSNRRGLSAIVPLPDQVIEGYYLQGSYRLRPNLEWMIRYEEGFADKDDRSGERLASYTLGQMPAAGFFSRIWTSGLRWDLTPQLMLRLEYQRHHGTFILSFRENPPGSPMTRDWDVWAASVSVRF